MASADTSIFSFQVGAFPLDTFRVIEFIGHEALSQCYTFTVRAVAFDTELKFDEGIGVAGALFVRGADYEVIHYGVITAFTQVPDSDGTVALNHTYEFTLEPRVRWASYTVQSRIFQNKTVLEIADEVLADYLMKDTDYKIDAKYEVGGQNYAKREFTVQYNETDLDFLQRLLEDEGLFYFFDHSGDREVLIITNKKDAVKAPEKTPKLSFLPEIGMHGEASEYVNTLRKTMRWMSGSRTTVKDYNYRTPDTKVMGMYEMEGTTGEFYHYGDHVKTPDEAKRLAQIRAEMFFCGRETYHGTGVARGMQAGRRFTLEHADAEGFNGDYLITQVTHHGDLDTATENTDGTTNRPRPHYTNSFEAIPAAVQFRPRLNTVKPKAPGILTAKVDGQKGSYAYIDEEGRYRMKLFFDRGEDKDGKASKAIRLAQPYAGAGYGMHFPLHTETEIAVGFVDGDLDRPIGLGALPNPSKGTPVKAGNKHQNMMKSHSGNTFTLEDKEGSTGIHLASSGGHKMGFDDAAGSKGFSVKTSGGHGLALDDKGKKIGLTTTGGHSLTLTDEGKAISIATTGKLVVNMDDAGKSISISDSGSNSIVLDAAGKKISLAADTDISITGKSSITLTSGSSSISLKSDGTIAISGKSVSITGTDSVSVGPKAVSLNGSDKVTATSSKEVSLGVASSSVSVKPDGVSTSGAKVSASAIGVHEIGGALIKIG